MRKIILAGVAAGGLAFAAASAHATVFVLDSYTVTANVGNSSGDDGLTVNTQNLLKIPTKATKGNPVVPGLDIDLGAKNDQTFKLFNISTPEASVNSDDLAPVPIEVTFNFSSPSPNSGPTTVGGDTEGNLVLFGIFQDGSVTWNNTGVFNWTAPGFTNPGVMDITLSNGTFNGGLFGLSGGSKDGTTVDATFDWKNDPNGVAGLAGGVPEPASWALMIGGFGMAGGMLRRRRTAAAVA